MNNNYYVQLISINKSGKLQCFSRFMFNDLKPDKIQVFYHDPIPVLAVDIPIQETIEVKYLHYTKQQITKDGKTLTYYLDDVIKNIDNIDLDIIWQLVNSSSNPPC